MSQTAQSLDSSIDSRSSELRSLDTSRLIKSSIEDRKRARRLSINNRELLIAISENNFEKVKRLINGEIDIHFRDRDGNTPLHWAIEAQNLDIIKLLLRKEEDVKCETNKTWIDYVKSLHRPDILQILEASVNVKSQIRDEEIFGNKSVQNKEDRVQSAKADEINCRETSQAERETKAQDEHVKISQIDSAEIGQVDCKNTDRAAYEKMDNALKQLDQSIHTTFRKFEHVQFYQPNERETRNKKQTSAIHGYIYQLKLLMLFLYRGVSRHYSFRLGTEIVEAKKFDDLVFEYDQDGKKVYRLLQAKHKQDESKKITAYNLLTEKNGDYNLVKYFLSYQNSKHEELFKSGSIKDVTICTNIDWDYEDLKSVGITVVKIENKDDVLDIKSSEKQSLRYKFGKNVVSLLKSKLKKHGVTNSAKKSVQYTDNEIQDFLDHLVFAVDQPNEEELGRIVEDEMGKEFGFITTENVYNKLFIKMLNWLKDKNMNRFLSYKEGKEFFEEARTGIPLWFNVKSPTHAFVGRVKQLNNLHEMLQGQHKSRAQFISISGLGGVGKSELVKQYVDRYSRQYDNKVIWINAESYRTLVESFHRLARDKLRISTINADNNEKKIASIVEDVYKFLSEGKSLFIFDNAEKYKSESEFDHGIENFLPSLPPGYNKPYILITSRNKKWPENVHVLHLDVFTEDEATEFVKKSLNVQDEVQECGITDLVMQLHCLPLALQQAMAYVKVHDQKLKNVGKVFKVHDYLNKYKQKAGELLAFKFSESTEDDYTKTIYTTWNVTLDMIKQKQDGDDALQILYVASYLAPEDIPTEMLLKLINDSDKLASAVELLKQYSIVNLEHTAINVHRLVQQVIRIKLKKQEMEEKVLVKALELFYDSNVNSENINHAISLYAHINKYSTLVVGTLYLTHLIIQELMDSARYDEAYSFSQKMLQLIKTLRKSNIGTTFLEPITKNNIGLIYLEQGKYNMAYEIFQEVLNSQQLISGQYSPATITVKSNLALVLVQQGEYTKALKYYKEIYDMLVSLGSDNFYIMNIKADIAAIFLKQGKVNEALLMLQEVCNFQERALGKHHPLTLEGKSRISYALVEQSKFDEALKILREIHYAEKCISKKKTRRSVITMANMAGILFKQGKFNPALKIYQEVLHADEEVLGEDHPDVLMTRRHIVEVLREQGKFDEALVMCQHIFDKQKRILRVDHPDIVCTLHTKAVILDCQGKDDAALKVYQEVLIKLESVYGNDHPRILSTRNAIGALLARQGNYDEALGSCREVFQMQQKNLGEDHVDTLYTKNNIGMILYHKQEYDNALQIFQEVYNKFQALYPYHPNLYDTKNNIGLVLIARKQYDEALEIYKDVLNFQEKYFGKEHPSLTTTKNNVVSILILQKRFKESIELLHDVFKGQIKVLGPNHPITVGTRNNIESVLLEAIHADDVEEIRHFFERDASITVANFDSVLLLHNALTKGNTDIVNVLLKSGAHPTAVNSQGKTALHVAVAKDYRQIVEVLLRDIKSDKLSNFINAKTAATGSTALHIAARYGHLEMVTFLLKRGAIYNLENNNGKTPFSLSHDRSIANLLKLVEELFGAAKNGNVELINRLKTLQYDVLKAVTNARNNRNDTLLLIMKSNNHKNLLTKYLEILKSM